MIIATDENRYDYAYDLVKDYPDFREWVQKEYELTNREMEIFLDQEDGTDDDEFFDHMELVEAKMESNYCIFSDYFGQKEGYFSIELEDGTDDFVIREYYVPEDN